MRVDLFDFDLPQELIAQRPVSPRLLDVAPDGLHDRTVRDLPALLQPGDLLVFNDTKVIPARLIGTRTSGGKVEALLIRARGPDRWLAFAKPGKKLKIGDVLAFDGLRGKVAAKYEDGSVDIAFDRSGPALLAAIETAGAVPLPPYIRGGTADARDRADYQTLFAKRDGSVAAPTAGLHFTPELMARLAEAPAPSSRCGSTTPTSTRCTPNGARSRRRPSRPSPGPSGSSRSARRQCACSKAWRAMAP